MFQNYSLLPWLSALGNVQLAVASAFPVWTRAQQVAQSRRYLGLLASATPSSGGPASCRAACARGWRSPARSRPSRRFSSWTSRSARSTR